MATEVLMPQMGESIAEGTITKWLVKVGEKVERDQPLFEISTDKVDAEIPSPASGVLQEVLFEVGATVPVYQVVARIGDGAAAAATPPAEAASPAPVAPAPPAPVEVPAAAPATPAPALAPTGEETLEERLRRASSPVVRKIAEAEGVDITQLTGSGIHGRVTKRDIETHLEERGKAPMPAPAPAPAPVAAAPAPAPAPAPPRAAAPAPAAAAGTKQAVDFHVAAYTEGEDVEIEPMSKIRAITAAHMRYSKDTSAHVTTVFHLDMSGVSRAREKARRKFEEANGTKLTFMPFIFKAVAQALKRNKKMNAAIDGNNVVYKKSINLGMAVALDWGLVVPVLRNADQLSLVGLAKAANDLADRARSKKLGPDELKGGTFTITNPGVFGTLFGMPIINQPQVAILGIGAIEKRAVVATDANGNDMIVIKPMSYFAITYDHRLIDGADADHFMNDVKKTLQEETWQELSAYM
ncbi:MAG TPA: dihydrolipoamide acetyltransferase family protein [Thermoanaerobaculia bacterium]|nr:dihydrolipoamide acetyltransferase family protein [Thermoanaerobaculia bacterium]